MPLNPGVTPVDITDILNRMVKQLTEAGHPNGPDCNKGAGLGATNAFLSLWPDQLHLKNPRSKQFVVIRPQRFPVWQSIVQGSGTTYEGYDDVYSTLGFNMVFSTVMFVAITGSDPEMRSARTLTEDVTSIMPLAMKIIASMQFWMPQDADGNLLLREPARLLDSGLQVKPVNAGDAWWVQGSLDFEAKFSVRVPTP